MTAFSNNLYGQQKQSLREELTICYQHLMLKIRKIFLREIKFWNGKNVLVNPVKIFFGTDHGDWRDEIPLLFERVAKLVSFFLSAQNS